MIDIIKALGKLGDSTDGRSELNGVINSLPKGESPAIGNVMTWVFGILGMLAVMFIIVGGFQMVTAGGDAGKVTKAKNTIIWAAAGLALAILAYAITNFIMGRMG